MHRATQGPIWTGSTSKVPSAPGTPPQIRRRARGSVEYLRELMNLATPPFPLVSLRPALFNFCLLASGRNVRIGRGLSLRGSMPYSISVRAGPHSDGMELPPPQRPR